MINVIKKQVQWTLIQTAERTDSTAFRFHIVLFPNKQITRLVYAAINTIDSKILTTNFVFVFCFCVQIQTMTHNVSPN